MEVEKTGNSAAVFYRPYFFLFSLCTYQGTRKSVVYQQYKAVQQEGRDNIKILKTIKGRSNQNFLSSQLLEGERILNDTENDYVATSKSGYLGYGCSEASRCTATCFFRILRNISLLLYGILNVSLFEKLISAIYSRVRNTISDTHNQFK